MENEGQEDAPSVHHIPQGGHEGPGGGEIATNNRLISLSVGGKYPFVTHKKSKHLTQPAARNGEEISHNAVRKQPELCGRDSGLREEN